MIKILIVEDNVEKLKRISSFLNNVCNIPNDDIEYAGSVNDGRAALMGKSYDLLLLDLVLPVNSGDDPSPENGTGFLEEIHYNPNINIPIHIIGLTEFEQVFKDFYETFEDKLWGLINFKVQDNDWVEKLKSKIFYLQNFKSRYQLFIEEKSKYDVAIITALNIEFEQLVKTGKWSKVSNEDDQLIYYETVINTKSNNNVKVIASCINQMGMQASAAVGAKIITKFSPKYVFITGICAGLKEKNVNLGDIIIATQCWDYESGKIVEGKNGELLFKPDMKLIPTDQGMLSKLTDFSNKKNLLSSISNEFNGKRPDTYMRIIFGSVGTGPYVLSSKQYLQKLTDADRKLIGIDMEGFGIYKAAQFHKNTFPIFIKGVSDFGDHEKGDDYQTYAAYVSSSLAMSFIYEVF